MPAFKNLKGDRFGRWFVISQGESKSCGSRFIVAWKCKCDCGKERCVISSDLLSGKSKSCGCDRSGQITHGATGTKLYRAWKLIKNRCYNPNCEKFHCYGGRGITMQPEWKDDFSLFALDVGEPPSLNHWIDRIKTDGNYERGNVRWATPEEQQNNRRNNIQVTCNGSTMTLSRWSRKLALKPWKLRDLKRSTGESYETIIAKFYPLANIQPEPKPAEVAA